MHLPQQCHKQSHSKNPFTLSYARFSNYATITELSSKQIAFVSSLKHFTALIRHCMKKTHDALRTTAGAYSFRVHIFDEFQDSLEISLKIKLLWKKRSGVTVLMFGISCTSLHSKTTIQKRHTTPSYWRVRQSRQQEESISQTPISETQHVTLTPTNTNKFVKNKVSVAQLS